MPATLHKIADFLGHNQSRLEALKCYVNVLLIIAFFCRVFHVTFNGRNPLLKNDGSLWGSLDIQIMLHILFIMARCFVL